MAGFSIFLKAQDCAVLYWLTVLSLVLELLMVGRFGHCLSTIFGFPCSFGLKIEPY